MFGSGVLVIADFRQNIFGALIRRHHLDGEIGRTTDLAVVEETIATVFATRFGYDAVVECVS